MTTAESFYNLLVNPSTPIGQRYRAIFQLKNLQSQPNTVNLMIKSFPYLNNSQLMKHQLVYTLGQLHPQHYPTLKPFLFSLVRDQTQQHLVRHQAAEAIANYFDPDSKPLFEEFRKSQVEYLAMTCEIALWKIGNQREGMYGRDYAGTREPIAPFEKEEFQGFLDTEQGLRGVFEKEGVLGVMMSKISLVDRYRVLYWMRNQNNSQVRLALCKLLSLDYYKTQPALLKHQICFVLGQIGIDEGEQQTLIRQCIENEQEQDIVRHEALAAVASQSKDQEYLKKFEKHPSQLIRESALVAIDEIKYWKQ